MENEIFKAIKNFGSKAATWNIANSIGMRGKTSEVLKIMKKLESEGKVERHHATTINNIVWTVPTDDNWIKLSDQKPDPGNLNEKISNQKR